MFGARIGCNVHVHPTATVTIPWNLQIEDFASVGDGARIYNLGKVTIGRAVTVSQFAHLCAGTHDYTRADFPLIKAPIRIEDGAWVCADAFIGPDVTVGAYAIVGARAVAVRDVDAWTIVAGNPATVVRQRPAIESNESFSSPPDA
jgi:putative colanic acid biosynthesis acetyltransferase WcaF